MARNSIGIRRTSSAAAWAALTLVAALLLASAPLAAAAAGPPSAPRSVASTPANGQVTVSWSPPKSTGGARIDRYRVTHWLAGSSTRKTVKLAAAARELTVKQLRNGARYVFQVTAHNKHGWGEPSPRVSAVPRTKPGAPVAVAATPEQGAIALAWSDPATDGGAVIDKYGVRLSTDGGRTWVPAETQNGTDEVATTSAVVTGLVDGSPYDGPVAPYLVHVRAHNVAGWGAWSPARLAPDALEQMPPFVPGNSLGDAAAAAFRDRLTGSWWTGGYPTPAGSGEWHDGGPVVFEIPPSCGTNPSYACPGGTPQEPAPTVVVDLTEHVGDPPRRSVANVAGQSRYDLTYRARVSTPEPVSITYSGTTCTLDVDSTAGSVPSVTVAAQVGFSNFGWETRPTIGTVSLSDFEDDDYTLSGPFLCQVAPVPSAMIRDMLASAVADNMSIRVADTCGADEPEYWQPCFPIVDSPPPSSAPDPVSRCPDAPPHAGPYLTLTCDGKKVVRACATGWVDADGLVATGCERSAGGLEPVLLSSGSATALADHLSGSFFLGGYPGGVGAGSWYAAPNPVPVDLPPCPGTPFGCPADVPQKPMPQLELDLGEHGDLGPRRAGSWDPESGVVHLSLRGRVDLDAPVAFLHAGVGCQAQIDTTNGALADIALNVAASGTGNGPLTIAGYSDVPQMYTLQGLEDEDVTIGPHRWCSYWASGVRSQVRSWVRDTLLAWAQREGALCGASAPFFWQRCP